MAILPLTLYTGNVPLIGQTQIDFDTNTGNILTYLNSFGTDLNTRTGEINTVLTDINTKSAQVSADKISTASYALIAQGSANYKGNYSAGATYAQGESVTDETSGVNYVSKLGGNIGNALSNSTYWKLATINAKAIGNINNPLLDLPLNNSLSLKQGVGSVTFTRATTATFIDRYGVLQSAAIDEARFEKEGLLIEGASTNLITYSNDFTNVSWVKVNSGAGLDPIVDGATGYLSPDGTNNASRVTYDIGDSTPINSIYHQFTNFSGNRTVSIWLRAVSGETTIYLTTQDDGAESSNVACTLTSQWQRFDLTLNIPTAVSNQSILIGWYTAAGTPAGPSTPTIIEIYEGQVESLPFASSNIKTTTTTVTRTIDICTIPFYNNSGATFDESTTIVDFEFIGVNDTLQLVFENGVPIVLYYNPTSNVFISAEGTITQPTVKNGYVKKARFAQTFDGTTLKVYFDGVNIFNTNLSYGSLSPSSDIRLGSGAGGLYPMFGYIKNFRTYQGALTAEEIAIA